MNISFTNDIRRAAPALKVATVECSIVNAPTSDELWNELTATADQYAAVTPIEQVNKRPAIAATRAAYKALGKDPNRYRPAAEQLSRRIVRGLGLYRLTSAVDAINLFSVATGYSVGGFDADRIVGANLELGRGRADEPFEGIGRGELNIDGLPVYRDAVGGIGTPTSDNERTKITPDTTHLLAIINIYGEEMPPAEAAAFMADLLRRHCSASDIIIKEYTVAQ